MLCYIISYYIAAPPRGDVQQGAAPGTTTTTTATTNTYIYIYIDIHKQI